MGADRRRVRRRENRVGRAGAHIISPINGEAALLSGTPAKSRAKDASGGLLRKISGSGVLVVKDFTSILSMNRDTRALLLAALREIYDGHWSRNVGTDGQFLVRDAPHDTSSRNLPSLTCWAQPVASASA